MRHRVAKKHFGRDTKHRQALLRNLVRSLVEQGQIVTTLAKAKEVKRVSDKIIYRAAKSDLTTRRELHRFFGKRDVVNTLVEKIAPAMAKRVSGYTRIVRLGLRRGDNSKMVKLELVVKPEGLGTLRSGKTKADYKQAKPKAKRVKQAKVKKSPVKKAAASKTTKAGTKKITKK